MISPVKVWRNQKQQRELFGKTGKIVSYTMIRVPPDGFSSQAPYPLAIVRLTDGKQIPAQIVDWEEKNIQIGQKVVVVIRRTIDVSDEGIIPYGIKVKPV